MLPTNLKILWIGGLTGVTGTGEQPDELHMARCLKEAGVDVTTVDRAEVHAFFKGAKQDNIPPEGKYDIIILGKWHHFTEEIIKGIKQRYQGKLVYFLWDWMGVPTGWHEMILKNCDLYLSGELGLPWNEYYVEHGIKFQYFNWDSSDGQYDQLPRNEIYDVVFTGTYIQKSYRNAWLKKIHDRFNLTIFSWDYAKWREQGFNAEPGKYDSNFNQLSAQSRVMLCFNWPEPNLETMGYQSNRIGKILTTGGLPFVHYFPMAERLLGDKVPMFYKEVDMMENLKWFLDNPIQRETARVAAYDFGRANYTTQTRMKQLKLILESL